MEDRSPPVPISSQAEYYDLGVYRRSITTASQDAHEWFNRGLIWSYGFHHEESAVCFQQAIAHDSKCAMGYWGLAYSLGPNYNKPWEFFQGEELKSTVQRTHDAIELAKACSDGASPVEKAMIEALRYRYPQNEPTKDWSVWNREYADAMGKVWREFPHDLDVATLYADALMNLTPWKLWDIKTGKPSKKARTMEVKEVLETSLQLEGGMKHPGLLHLHIHYVEMSPSPETGLTIADNLRGLVPDSGHLQHMPSHLDVLCGDYRRAVTSNADASRADQKYFEKAGSLHFYSLYRAHDTHFRLYAAMFSGQSKEALAAVEQLESYITEELLNIKSPPMADWLEGFLAMRVHALIRFGLWQDIIRLPLPIKPELYCSTTAMIHYAKGIAYGATNQVKEGEQQQLLFREAVKRVPDSRTVFNNRCVDLLKVAAVLLEGELAYRRKEYDLAFASLRESIKRAGSLPYDEPWGWMQPPRHAYGALALEQGLIEEAAAAYRADLGLDYTIPRQLQHPNNVWALHGYHECLVKLGRNEEARLMEPQLKLALAVADVDITSSCFCRLSTVACCKL